MAPEVSNGDTLTDYSLYLEAVLIIPVIIAFVAIRFRKRRARSHPATRTMAHINRLDDDNFMKLVGDVNLLLDTEQNHGSVKPDTFEDVMKTKLGHLKNYSKCSSESRALLEIECLLQLRCRLMETGRYVQSLVDDYKVAPIDPVLLNKMNIVNHSHDEKWTDLDPVVALDRFRAIASKPSFTAFQQNWQFAGAGDDSTTFDSAMRRKFAQLVERIESCPSTLEPSIKLVPTPSIQTVGVSHYDYDLRFVADEYVDQEQRNEFCDEVHARQAGSLGEGGGPGAQSGNAGEIVGLERPRKCRDVTEAGEFGTLWSQGG